MAETILRAQVSAQGLKNYHSLSAGLSARDGAPASPGALAAMRDMGLDLTGHRAQSLTSKLISSADLILAMTVPHRDHVLYLDESAPVQLLSTEEEAGYTVEDPFGCDDEVYARTARQIEREVIALLERLERFRALQQG